jgi:copper transport protein
MEVWLEPGRAGRNDIHVILMDSEGVADDRFDEAEFALSLPAQDVGPIKAEPVRIGTGHFQLVGTDLSIRGQWTIQVTVRPDRFTLTEGTASFTIS